jgi:hypothetical protein
MEWPTFEWPNPAMTNPHVPNFKVSNAESDQLYEWPILCLTNWLHVTNSLTGPTTNDQLWQMTNYDKWLTANDQLQVINYYK